MKMDFFVFGSLGLMKFSWNLCESESEVTQSYLTLCNPMPGSSIHGIFQARVLEWVAISFSRGSSPPRDQTQVCLIVGRRFNHLSHQGRGKFTAIHYYLKKQEKYRIDNLTLYLRQLEKRRTKKENPKLVEGKKS